MKYAIELVNIETTDVDYVKLPSAKTDAEAIHKCREYIECNRTRLMDQNVFLGFWDGDVRGFLSEDGDAAPMGRAWAL